MISPSEKPIYLGIGWSVHAEKWYCRMQEWGGNPHDTFFTSREEAEVELESETVRLAIRLECERPVPYGC